MEICLIDADGLDEEIRCEMCRNPMRSDTGCDGGCIYDEKLYEKIVRLLNERIKPLPNIKPEPERKTGRWIDGQCSNCGCDIPAYIIDWKWQKDMDANFCPNCGARMEGDAE